MFCSSTTVPRESIVAFLWQHWTLLYLSSGIITPIRCDDTSGCIIQFWPPDDEHMYSKHVEAWNKLIVKQTFCASSWLITEINILRCTVSKTSQLLYCWQLCLGQRWRENVLLLFYFNNGFAKAPKCNVLTFSFLLS